jgi:hypothetical protein
VGFVRIDLSEVHALADDLRKAGDTIPAKAERDRRRRRPPGARRMRPTRPAPIDTGTWSPTPSVDIVGLEFEAGPTAEYAIYQSSSARQRMAASRTPAPGSTRSSRGSIDALADAGSRIL